MASKLQRLDELTGPTVVGKFYLTPHVAVHGESGFFMWVPVRGSVHADGEIGVNFKHLHYDERFLTKAQLKELGADWVNVHAWLIAVEGGDHINERRSDGVVYWLKAKCRTNKIGFAYEPRITRSPLWQDWMATYKDRTLEKGRCPHRGFDLTTIPANDEGLKVCPLHGLTWCAKTGKNRPNPVIAEMERMLARNRVELPEVEAHNESVKAEINAYAIS